MGGFKRDTDELINTTDRQSDDSMVEAPRSVQTPAPETNNMMGVLKR